LKTVDGTVGTVDFLETVAHSHGRRIVIGIPFASTADPLEIYGCQTFNGSNQIVLRDRLVKRATIIVL